MKKSLLTIISLVFVTALAAQSPELGQLSKSAAGGRVVSYFAAFNSGDEEKLRAFFLDNIAPEALKQRPVEPRLAVHRQLRNDFQTVEIKSVVSIAESEIKVLAKSVNGTSISYSFVVDPATNKLAGFRIEPEESSAPKSGAQYPQPATRAEVLATTDRMFTDLAKADAFSGVVTITKDGEQLFAKAYGYADAVNKKENTLDTRFNLGSINKDFTRVAIGMLIKQGKLKWDSKLIDVLPGYPNREAARKITIGQLVTMSSGIGDFVNSKFWSMDRKTLRDHKDFLILFGTEPLLFEPGTSKRYSNGGYVVLGLVVEKLSGLSYYEYVRENIFKPLGMTDSDSYFMDKLPAKVAFGYTQRHQKPGAGRGRNDTILSARGSAAGGGYSTAADLLKFANALRNKKVEYIDDQGTFPSAFAGLGSAGGSEGVNALLETDNRTGYTVIVLSNVDPPSAERPGMQVFEWLRQVKQ